jgi:hypothetical protein
MRGASLIMFRFKGYYVRTHESFPEVSQPILASHSNSGLISQFIKQRLLISFLKNSRQIEFGQV